MLPGAPLSRSVVLVSPVARTRNGEVPDEGDSRDGRGGGTGRDGLWSGPSRGRRSTTSSSRFMRRDSSRASWTRPSTWNRSRSTGTERVDPWAPAGRSGHCLRLWHDGTVGGTARVGLTDLYLGDDLAEMWRSRRGTLAPPPGDVDSTAGRACRSRTDRVAGTVRPWAVFGRGRALLRARSGPGAVGSTVTRPHASSAHTSSPPTPPPLSPDGARLRRARVRRPEDQLKTSAASIWCSTVIRR